MSVSLYSLYKYALWVGIAIPAIQQLSGVNAIMYYAPTMFKSQGNLKFILTLITTFLNFAFTLISVFVSDKLGRRFLFIYGSIGCVLGLVCATIGYTDPDDPAASVMFGTRMAMNWTFNSGVFFFIAAFGLSHGPIW
eukprot:TRINITY_DN3054_c0_g1_i2.p3 TRINITY_DN3054_c0_g1~~TRINITY_DN3054_c0_g1_i2.p3  ORF type:complete len:137 (-),score=32.77 TRINITY_DN3054_c0_g1_i2:475-885(-)